jgi:glutathione S-transferase
MIRIYHSRRARSVRVIWLLEELGVPYEVEGLEFKRETLKSPDYLKLHPLGQIPVIQDGEFTMFESGAIVEYLLEKYGEGKLAPPPGTRQRGEYLQWFHFGEAGPARHVGELVKHRFENPEHERIPEMVTESRERLRGTLAVIERALDGRNYILGADFTAADIMIAYGIVIAKIIRELPADLPNLVNYIARLKERPAYQRAWA